MYGVVSLLDKRHYQLVENLWAEMEHRFSVRGILDTTPYPHFSYHVAKSYDVNRLFPMLARFAKETAVFTVTTTGVGLFTGPEPVIYIPVSRDPTLTAVHQRLWPQLEAISEGDLAYYAPPNWFPHITLGHGDITGENLGPIVSWLNEQDLTWQIPVDNFALLGGKTPPHELHFRLELEPTIS